jgi:hypothetical protein
MMAQASKDTAGKWQGMAVQQAATIVPVGVNRIVAWSISPNNGDRPCVQIVTR